jgi:hypothetical protein
MSTAADQALPGREGVRRVATDRPMTTWEGPSVEAAGAAHRLMLGDFLLEVCAAYAGREALVFDDPLKDRVTVRRGRK